MAYNVYRGAAREGEAAARLRSGAAFSTSALALGEDSVTACYAGDTSHAAGTSAALSQQVNETSNAPMITGFTPSSGGAGTIVTITGTGFTPDSSVSFNGSTAVSLGVSGSAAITAAVPADACGTGPIIVTADGGVASSESDFTVVPAPAIIALSPSVVTAGSASFNLTVTGTGFYAGSTVALGGSPLATTFISPTTLTATVPAADVASAGALNVVVGNDLPDGGESAAATLQIAATAELSLSIDPSVVVARNTAAGMVSMTSISSSDTQIALSSSDPCVLVPDTVTVSAGQASATFTMEALPEILR